MEMKDGMCQSEIHAPRKKMVCMCFQLNRTVFDIYNFSMCYKILYN